MGMVAALRWWSRFQFCTLSIATVLLAGMVARFAEPGPFYKRDIGGAISAIVYTAPLWASLFVLRSWLRYVVSVLLIGSGVVVGFLTYLAFGFFAAAVPSLFHLFALAALFLRRRYVSSSLV